MPPGTTSAPKWTSGHVPPRPLACTQSTLNLCGAAVTDLLSNPVEKINEMGERDLV